MNARNLILFGAVVLLAGCATAPPPQVDASRADCSKYTLSDMPAHAALIGREPTMPTACMPSPNRGHGDKQRVVLVRGDGSSRVVYAPRGTVVGAQ